MNETMYTLLHRRSVRKYKQDEVDRKQWNKFCRRGSTRQADIIIKSPALLP